MTIFYPVFVGERRMIPRDQLNRWAGDAVANGDTDINATAAEIAADFDLCRKILSDSGYAEVLPGRRECECVSYQAYGNCGHLVDAESTADGSQK